MKDPDYVGKIIDGKYIIISLLGKGGMGSVYLGMHIVIGKQVAIKFLHTEFAKKKNHINRFYREAQAAAAIGHKNIIDVMDVGVSEKGEPYLVMEYLEGESLSNMLSRTKQADLAATCGIMEPVLLALSSAHDKGIIHRDLKPDNVFLVRQRGEMPSVKLIDFGISKFIEDVGHPQLTRQGFLLGTPSYMSPEQVNGETNIDHRADLYTVGVIMYEMLTGGLPFIGNNYTDLLIKVISTVPRPPKEVYPDFPAEAEPMIARALEKERSNRYQNADDMLDAIRMLSGFSQRREQLSLIASGAKRISFAGGELGKEVSSDGDGALASKMLSQMAGKATPQGWARTAVQNERRRGIFAGLLSVITILVVAVFLLWYSDARSKFEVVPLNTAPRPPRATKVAPTKQGQIKRVQIKVEGVPQGATIIYNNTKVQKNPFRVKRGENLMPLRVEVAGYETFFSSVLPVADQVVKLSLKATDGKKVSTKKKSKHKRTSKRRSRSGYEEEKKEMTIENTIIPPEPPVPTVEIIEKPQEKKIREGGSGTKYAEDFE